MTFFDGGRIYLNNKPKEYLALSGDAGDVASLTIHTPLLEDPLTVVVSNEDYETLRGMISFEEDSPHDVVLELVTWSLGTHREWAGLEGGDSGKDG